MNLDVPSGEGLAQLTAADLEDRLKEWKETMLREIENKEKEVREEHRREKEKSGVDAEPAPAKIQISPRCVDDERACRDPSFSGC